MCAALATAWAMWRKASKALRVSLALIIGWLCAFASLADSCDEPGSRSRESYHSDLAGHQRYYSLYLPPCYATKTERYPLLMLLHGSNADDSQWERLGFLDALEDAIRQGAAPNMIVVLPFGDAIANSNRFDGISYDQLLLELIGRIKRQVRADGRAAIGGISRGGFWAYQLGLRYLEEFVAIGGHSAYFDESHVAAAHNPLKLASRLPASTNTRLWLDRGSRDHAADGVDRMVQILNSRDLAHEYRVYAGAEHNEDSWRSQISDYLEFYAAAFERPDVSAIAAEAPDPPASELWLPAVAFPALQVSIARDEFEATLRGELNRRLLMTDSAAERLRGRGIRLHQATRIVADDALQAALWRDKSGFTLLPFDALNLRYRPLWLENQPIVDQLDGYPLRFDDGVANFDADKLLRVTLSGTTAIARQTRAAFDKLGVEYAISGIQEYVAASDIFHTTVEAPIAPSCPGFTEVVLGGANSLCMKPEHAGVFAALGLDLVDLSGNHINDFGYAVLEDNLAYFAASDIAVIGAGRDLKSARQPLIIERNGNRIAILACNAIGPYYALVNEAERALGGIRPGAAFCDREWLRDALPVIEAEADALLLTVHYREHEAYAPTAQQRADYRQYAEWGADAVIGTAEHKPMTYEFYRARRGETVLLHYGMGNLFFDQQFWGNRRFLMDTLIFYAGELLTSEFFPGIIDDQARPRLLQGEEQFNFLHFMLIQQNGF